MLAWTEPPHSWFLLSYFCYRSLEAGQKVADEIKAGGVKVQRSLPADAVANADMQL